jgi:hypothetical protein
VSFRCAGGTIGYVGIQLAQSMSGGSGQYGSVFTQVSCTGATQKVSVPIIGADGRAWTTRSVFMLVTVSSAHTGSLCGTAPEASPCQGYAWGTVPVVNP